jgi:hypothetical protein
MANNSSVITAPEFLRLRQTLTDNPDTLDKFDEQLIAMCTRQPDDAAQILSALANSDDVEDRKSAAAYLWHLFVDRHDAAAELTHLLLTDSSDDVRELATDGVYAAADSGTISSTDAANILNGR